MPLNLIHLTMYLDIYRHIKQCIWTYFMKLHADLLFHTPAFSDLQISQNLEKSWLSLTDCLGEHRGHPAHLLLSYRQMKFVHVYMNDLIFNFLLGRKRNKSFISFLKQFLFWMETLIFPENIKILKVKRQVFQQM